MLTHEELEEVLARTLGTLPPWRARCALLALQAITVTQGLPAMSDAVERALRSTAGIGRSQPDAVTP